MFVSLSSSLIQILLSDLQGLNPESCVWRTVSSHSSHHPQEVHLAQFSLYVHKSCLKSDSCHFICQPASKLYQPEVVQCWLSVCYAGPASNPHCINVSCLLGGATRAEKILPIPREIMNFQIWDLVIPSVNAYHQTQHSNLIMVWLRSSVADGGPTLKQHSGNVSCLSGANR